MLNHRRPRQTTWAYSNERGGFIIEALEDIKRGDQVYDSYGKKCNNRFLQNYGFINLNNDANEFPLKVDIKDDDPLKEKKLAMMPGRSSVRIFRVQTDWTEAVMQRFISFLRFAQFDENMAVLYGIQSQQKKQNPGHSDSDSDDVTPPTTPDFNPELLPTISRRNERRIFERIIELSSIALDIYPHTLEEDREILKDESLTFNQRNCVLFRSGEKEILHHNIEFGQYIINLLDLKFSDARKEVQNSLPSKFESSREYIQNQLLALLLRENLP